MMRWLVVFFALCASPLLALECSSKVYLDTPYTICRMDPSETELRLFLNNPDTGKPLGSFKNVEAELAKEGLVLDFAMNAGMYHQDRRPVGHFLQDGVETAPVVSAPGPGNFGLLPNGVFCIGQGWARVFETKQFLSDKPKCQHASQSGPMLVINGELHPRFLKDSDSLFVRNGVGTSSDGRTVWFAISERPVNFYNFALLFQNELNTPQALYFDGNISRVFIPELGRHDGGFPMGPIVGAVSPAR